MRGVEAEEGPIRVPCFACEAKRMQRQLSNHLLQKSPVLDKLKFELPPPKQPHHHAPVVVSQPLQIAHAGGSTELCFAII